MLSRRDLIATAPAAVVGTFPAAAVATSVRLSATASVAALAMATYPHPRLGAAFYGGIASDYLKGLDARARAGLDDFLAKLDADTTGGWAAAPVAQRDAILKCHKEDPFFAGFRWTTAELVYRDPKVWVLIGFEGSSLEQGGWLTRGFDDIDWLPRTT